MAFKMKGSPHKMGVIQGTSSAMKMVSPLKQETVVCASCGFPVDNHPYRHPIISTMTRNEWREKNQPELNPFDSDSTMYKQDDIETKETKKIKEDE